MGFILKREDKKEPNNIPQRHQGHKEIKSSYELRTSPIFSGQLKTLFFVSFASLWDNENFNVKNRKQDNSQLIFTIPLQKI
jgi:hypothetical protein